MPIPLRPAVNRGLARGLRVVTGEASAGARTRALRARTGRTIALPPSLEVMGAGGEAATWTPGSAHEAAARGRILTERIAEGGTELLEVQKEQLLSQGYTEAQVEKWAAAESKRLLRDATRKAGTTYSPEATSKQAVRVEALKRRAGKAETLDDLAAEVRGAGRPAPSNVAPIRPPFDPNVEARAHLTRSGDLTPEAAAEAARNAELVKGKTPKSKTLTRRASEDFTLWNPGKGPPPGMSDAEWAAAKARHETERAARPLPTKPEGPSDLQRKLYPELFGEKSAPAARSLLDAFEERFGWRPETDDAAKRMLSPEALRDLGFPEDL